MKTIKKYQGGGVLKAIGKGSRQMSSAAKATASELKAGRYSAMKDMGNYSRFEAPSQYDLRKGLPFHETNKNVKRTSEQIKSSIRKNYKKGGPIAKAKSGKSFPDLTGDGKVTRADILKGRGVIKNGGKLKKARGGATLSPSKTSTSNRLASYGRPLGKNLKKAEFGTTTPAQRRARTAAAIGRDASMKRKLRTAAALARPMMKMGGKCRGGCY